MRAKQRSTSCDAAVRECVKILTKPRIWTGKNTMAETTVKLVQAWVAAASEDDCDDLTLHGWEGSKGGCPCQPVALTNESDDDLFIGDKWFTTTPMEIEEDPKSVDSLDRHAPMHLEKEANEDGKVGVHVVEETDIKEIEDEKGKTTVSDERFEVVSFSGLCRFLVNEALPETHRPTLSTLEDCLPCWTKSLHSFHDLMNSLPPGNSEQRKLVFQQTASRLVSGCQLRQPGNGETKKEPPAIVAAAIESLGLCFWEGFGSTTVEVGGAKTEPLELCATLQAMGGNEQPAWTVRQAAPLRSAQLARTCDENILWRPWSCLLRVRGSGW